MEDWTPELPADASPLYVAIADALARDLRTGRLHVGARLPTHRELARRLGVNVVTVTRGYAEAARRGLVEGTVGRGTFVREHGRRNAAFMPLRSDESSSLDMGFNLIVCNRELLDPAGMLEELADDADDVPLVHEYTATGLDRHREVGAQWMERSGVPADASRTMLCGGAQHAMAVSISSLTSPNDVLLCDEVTYPGLNGLASVLHLRVVAVPSDEDGMLPGSLEDAVFQHKARVLYLMPNVHNPLGTVMPMRRRREIADVVRRQKLRVIEDDTYGFMLEERPEPLAALAPESTYFLTSLSKSLTAGLRVGYLALPVSEDGADAVLRRVSANVAAIAWALAPLMGEIATRLIESGAADAQAAWKREEASARRKLLREHLPQLRTASHPTTAHAWCPLPPRWDPEDFVRRARERGVHLNGPGDFAAGRARPPRAVRLCLGTPPTREHVVEGLERLAAILDEGPGGGAPVV